MIRIEDDDISYVELLVIDSDANKHTCDVVGVRNDGKLLLIKEKEFRSGNAYCLRREFFLIDNNEYLKCLTIATKNVRLVELIAKGKIDFEICYKGRYFKVGSDVRYVIQHKKSSIFTEDISIAEELHFNRVDRFEYEKTVFIKECDYIRITHKDKNNGTILFKQEFNKAEINNWIDTI